MGAVTHHTLQQVSRSSPGCGFSLLLPAPPTAHPPLLPPPHQPPRFLFLRKIVSDFSIKTLQLLFPKNKAIQLSTSPMEASTSMKGEPQSGEFGGNN